MLRTKNPQILYTLAVRHFTGKPLLRATNHLARQYTSPATSATATELQIPTSSPHPWPEWVSFVDRLKSDGYFPCSSPDKVDADGDDLVYRESKLLKQPCFSFARDRYDIFKSLPKDEIENIVDMGCPSLIRKAVNSSKRLREYVGLEERNVCDACSLKGSCDRAYLKLTDSEPARTVDIMRLLFTYALDPIVISGALRPSNIERAELSVRRLLSMLMDLSESAKTPASLELSSKDKSADSRASRMPQAVVTRSSKWICLKCRFFNPSGNIQCLKCNKNAPAKQEIEHVEVKKGDWHCSRCTRLNFARRTKCHHCAAIRPPESLKPGEWICSTCSYLNFRRNSNCLKCQTEHKEAALPDGYI